MKVFYFQDEEEEEEKCVDRRRESGCVYIHTEKKREGGTKASTLKVTSTRLLERSKCSLEKHTHTRGRDLSPLPAPSVYVRPSARPSVHNTHTVLSQHGAQTLHPADPPTFAVCYSSLSHKV